ncbi:TetR family transcriptional regulator [Microtetraspora sp. NBRC 13810]|uniref:TetR/AcrR family transcriptional regulator n=1 Tax=Microtetraspora sp. NBRC 13810 TaxID=3030990 RepID=UPI0024A06390|nr:TetR/AcrR family transcriptional regulator [Microtetraspora sp. NBRC 13810]GLW06877.1 TetR family transcriptional regulator [Microtetraspora sp. NBRC 13810]
MERDEKDRESIWQRLERPRPAPRVQLTHGQIADAAVEIADAEGLEAVSMRRLADRLGIATMGLYRYVRGRNDVVELMVDRVYGQWEPLAPDAGWREALAAAGRQMRRIRLAHPWLTEAGAPLTPGYVAYADRLLASMSGLDLDEDTKYAVVTALTSYVSGIADAQIHLARLLAREGVATMDELRTAYAPRMAWFLDSGRYPAFERYIRSGTRKDDTDWQFELGLAAVLDGIAARLGI